MCLYTSQLFGCFFVLLNTALQLFVSLDSFLFQIKRWRCVRCELDRKKELSRFECPWFCGWLVEWSPGVLCILGGSVVVWGVCCVRWGGECCERWCGECCERWCGECCVSVMCDVDCVSWCGRCVRFRGNVGSFSHMALNAILHSAVFSLFTYLRGSCEWVEAVGGKFMYIVRNSPSTPVSGSLTIAVFFKPKLMPLR